MDFWFDEAKSREFFIFNLKLLPNAISEERKTISVNGDVKQNH